MGCDVHFFLERKTNKNPWQIDPGHIILLQEYKNIDNIEIASLGGRNYFFFGLIAGVRWPRHKKYIAARGLPSDVSPEVYEMFYKHDNHTPSWINIKELEWALSKLEKMYQQEEEQLNTNSNSNNPFSLASLGEFTINRSVINYVNDFLSWEKAENQILGTKNKTKFRLVFWFDS